MQLIEKECLNLPPLADALTLNIKCTPSPDTVAIRFALNYCFRAKFC